MIVYSTGCPKCKVLIEKLNKKHIEYTIIDDVDTMKAIGIVSVPVLNTGNELLSFTDAVKFVNDIKE